MMPILEYGESDLNSVAFSWWLKSNYKGKNVNTETGLALLWQKHWPVSRLREKFRNEFLVYIQKFLYSIEYDDDGQKYQTELIDTRGYVHFPVSKEMLSYMGCLKNRPKKINSSILDRSEVKVMPNGAKFVSEEEMKRIKVLCYLNY